MWYFIAKLHSAVAKTVNLVMHCKPIAMLSQRLRLMILVTVMTSLVYMHMLAHVVQV
jgi:hypothetical protein